MPRKITGLYLDDRTGCWVINKQHRGRRIFERTAFGPGEREAAEARLHQLLAAAEAVSGPITADIPFRRAALRYLESPQTKRDSSLKRDRYAFLAWDDLIGGIPISHLHQGLIAQGIQARRAAGYRTGTIRREIASIRKLLTVCATEWRDEHNRPLLISVPKLYCPDFEDQARPHILTAAEQARLLRALPQHLAEMALFGLHTGLRDHTLSGLRWAWYRDGVLHIPGRPTADGWRGEKSRRDHVQPLNRVARSILTARDGQHPTHVFTYRGHPIGRMHNSGWKRAWDAAALPRSPATEAGPHNLRHTFGRRLEELGIEFEIRQALMGHSSGKVTHTYSPVNLTRMLDALERLADYAEPAAGEMAVKKA